MKHVIDNFISFHETQARATCAVLGELEKSLHSLGHEERPDVHPKQTGFF